MLVVLFPASAANASAVGGQVSREEILQRADLWYRQGYLWDPNVYHPDPSGKLYRSDCSGLVSMAWHLSTSESTGTLGQVSTRITVAELQPGDILLAQKDANHSTGHTAIFVKWANSGKTKYLAYDHGSGPIKYQVYDVQRPGDTRTYLPYRYNKAVDTFTRDFTTDSRPDLLAHRGDSGTLSLYRGNGFGGLQAATPLGNWAAFDKIVPVGDFDGDTYADLMARRADSGNLYLYRGNGSAGLYAGVLIGDWGGFSAITGVGDWDGDARPDVIGRSAASGMLYLYRGNGASGFYAGTVLSGSNWSIFSHIVGAGDFDRDGMPDLFARRGDSGNLYLYRGSFGGGLTAGALIGNWSAFNNLTGAGDWDGDGKLDLVARSAASGILYLYHGNGSGGLQYPSSVLNGSDWRVFDIIS